MTKEIKFGYGFLFVGAGVPYLIEQLLGFRSAILISIAFVVVGCALLWMGHRHSDYAPQRTWLSWLAIGASLIPIIAFAWMGAIRIKPKEASIEVPHPVEHTHLQWVGPASVKNYHLLPLKPGTSALGFGVKNVGDYPTLSGQMGVATGVVPTSLVTKSFDLAYKDIHHFDRISAMVAHPSRDEDWMYETYPVYLGEKQIKSLESGDAQLCAVGTAIWTDSTGTYETYLYRCLFVQADGSFNWGLQAEDNTERPYQVH
jgi:hypothetical protein